MSTTKVTQQELEQIKAIQDQYASVGIHDNNYYFIVKTI